VCDGSTTATVTVTSVSISSDVVRLERTGSDSAVSRFVYVEVVAYPVVLVGPNLVTFGAQLDPGTDSGQGSPSGLSIGAKTGVGVGVALLVLIGIAIFFLYRRRTKRKSNKVTSTDPVQAQEQYSGKPELEGDSGTGMGEAPHRKTELPSDNVDAEMRALHQQPVGMTELHGQHANIGDVPVRDANIEDFQGRDTNVGELHGQDANIRELHGQEAHITELPENPRADADREMSRGTTSRDERATPGRNAPWAWTDYHP
jgi:hypothetical protein